MGLLAVYVVMVIFGQAAGVLLTLFIDQYLNDGVALIIFFVLFFSIFVLFWPLAVKLTKPKDAPV